MKAEDHCRIEAIGEWNEETLRSLHLLYAPLLGNEAVQLYHLLYTFSHSRSSLRDHTLLLQLAGCSAERFGELRAILERYLLVKSYLEPLHQQYLYQVFPPMEGVAFLRHAVFGRRYLQQCGSKLYDAMRLYVTPKQTPTADYIDISAVFTPDAGDSWKDTQEEAFRALLPEEKAQAKLPVQFRYDVFLDGFERRFPPRLQTEENLRLIGELATVHGIDETQMRRFVNQCVNPRTGAFNIELLKKKARAYQSALPESKQDPYTLAPAQFLQLKQHGVPLSKSDRSLIESLLLQYRLPKEVINVLIEYVLERTNQKFNRSYVEKVAASWVRLGIDTRERAFAQIQAEKQGTSRQSQTAARLPKWYEAPDEKEAAEVDTEAIRRLQKQLRGE